MLGALLMPPLPMLVLVVLGACWLPRRRGLGWALLLAGVVGIWAASTAFVGSRLVASLTRPPPPLTTAQLDALRAAPNTAIVVLGAGRQASAPEYGGAALKPMSIERLRYGIWLARRTGLPLAFSGGVGHGSRDGPSEAVLAAAVAADEHGLTLRWAEGRSRDTGENARLTLPLLRAAGIERIVVVTHGFHMRRALGAFRRAAGGELVELVAAPMGLRPPASGGTLADWLPTAEGFTATRLALHEWIGRLAGA